MTNAKKSIKQKLHHIGAASFFKGGARLVDLLIPNAGAVALCNSCNRHDINNSFAAIHAPADTRDAVQRVLMDQAVPDR